MGFFLRDKPVPKAPMKPAERGDFDHYTTAGHPPPIAQSRPIPDTKAAAQKLDMRAQDEARAARIKVAVGERDSRMGGKFERRPDYAPLRERFKMNGGK